MFIMDDPERQEWTSWDIRLMTAMEIYTSMVNGEGVPVYWDRSDRVVFEVESFTSKSRAAIEREEEKALASKAKNFGKSFYVVPKTRDGGPLPTLAEFQEEQQLKRSMMAGNIKIDSEFSNASWKPE